MPSVLTEHRIARKKVTRWRRIRLILLMIPPCFAILPVALTLLFRFIAPPFSMLMIERLFESRESGAKYSSHYQWVDLDRIAPPMPLSVIASEDQNFMRHRGFDWKAIERAIDYDENGKRLHGASTITQQTAKNLFLWPNQNWIRKGLEAYFTVLLEVCWNKHRILETYLNIVEFGDGIYGVEAAAKHYFHKPAGRLTAEEAALLAAVLPNPHRLKANAPTAYLRGRQRWILDQMMHLRIEEVTNR